MVERRAHNRFYLGSIPDLVIVAPIVSVLSSYPNSHQQQQQQQQ